MSQHPTARLHHVQYGRSFRILHLLLEMGIEPEIVPYRIGDKAMREPGLTSRSPAGRIPALEIDGITIFESGAIVQYLCESRPEFGFAPQPQEAERVRFLEALGFAETMASLIEQLNLSQVFLRAPAKPSPTVVKLNRLRLGACLNAMEGMLAGDYLLERGFSGADAMMGFNLFAAPYYVKLDPWPRLQAYWDRLSARPAFERAIRIEGPQRFYDKDFYPVPEDG